VRSQKGENPKIKEATVPRSWKGELKESHIQALKRGHLVVGSRWDFQKKHKIGFYIGADVRRGGGKV